MQNISPIKQRILQFADTLGISMRSFYEKIGVSRGTLESKTGITEETLAKFIAVYPTINATWLIKGEGEMIIRHIDSPSEDKECNKCIEKEKTIKSLNITIDLLQEKVERLSRKKPYIQSEDITALAAEPDQKLIKK